MSRILDFGDTFSQYNVSSSEQVADEIATASQEEAVQRAAPKAGS